MFVNSVETNKHISKFFYCLANCTQW